MSGLDLIQGSDEWKAARVGSLGASRISDMLAKTKTGWAASRGNLMADLVAERLTGVPAASFTSSAMQWGIDTEPEACAAYSFRTDADVVEVGLIKHPTIAFAHASPDGLVSDDGLVEIKCPGTKQHIETLLGEPVSSAYVAQMNWQMACTGRRYCDFVSYDPRLPEEMRLFVWRLNRDDTVIAKLEADAAEFLAEVEAKVAALTAQYGVKEAA